MARMSITFDGFEQLAEDIDSILGSAGLKNAVDAALTDTGTFVQEQVNQAALPYSTESADHKYATGDMYNALKKNNPVIWVSSTVAEVSVGFDLSAKGGFHSIFMMYGTPRIQKDQKLYDSIFGSATKKEIARRQEAIMMNYMHFGADVRV